MIKKHVAHVGGGDWCIRIVLIGKGGEYSTLVTEDVGEVVVGYYKES
jgi:hypothetical protein